MNAPIKIESFVAGRYEPGFQYRYFVPDFVNRQWHWEDPQLGALLEKASISLGELNSFAKLVPNIALFLTLHILKEAVVSSRIEGTKTEIDEALLPKAEVDPERRDDWQEVHNYTLALTKAMSALKQIPVSSRLLCETHAILMQGVRGQHKMPGQFRQSQNWIGGASLADAAFIPPAQQYVSDLMGDLENFLHNDQIIVPDLIRIGIAHYQFETIHPFLDGNGRIGRLLISLFLIERKILDKPLLYLSSFFESKRSLYYDNLTRVREQNDLLHWLKYFLVGIDQTARQSSETLRKILALKNKLETDLQSQAGRRAQSAIALLSRLFHEPVLKVKQVEKICKLSPKAAGDLIALFEKMGILSEFTGKTRNRIFMFTPYLKLFR